MTKFLFLDTETSGIDSSKHAIVEIGAVFDTFEGEPLKELPYSAFEENCKPDSDQTWMRESFKLFNKTNEEIQAFQTQKECFEKFIKFLDGIVNQYDKTDKLWLIGWRISFDEEFIREWFRRNKNDYYGSYFYQNSIDAMTLTSYLTIGHRLSSYKLSEIAKFLGIEVDESKLHNASYDAMKSREIFNAILKTVPIPFYTKEAENGSSEPRTGVTDSSRKRRKA